MSETTEIEKKSLEAHVELCAERYKFLEQKLDTLENDVQAVRRVVSEVRDMMQKVTEKRNDQIIAWAVGAIGLLTATIGYLLSQHVFK